MSDQMIHSSVFVLISICLSRKPCVDYNAFDFLSYLSARHKLFRHARLNYTDY